MPSRTVSSSSLGTQKQSHGVHMPSSEKKGTRAVSRRKHALDWLLFSQARQVSTDFRRRTAQLVRSIFSLMPTSRKTISR